MEYEFIDIRQRHYRDFLIAIKEFQPPQWENVSDLPVEIYMDLLVRAAVKAEWFMEPLDLDNMKPRDVDAVAIAVAEVYKGLKEPDPN